MWCSKLNVNSKHTVGHGVEDRGVKMFSLVEVTPWWPEQQLFHFLFFISCLLFWMFVTIKPIWALLCFCCVHLGQQKKRLTVADVIVCRCISPGESMWQPPLTLRPPVSVQQSFWLSHIFGKNNSGFLKGKTALLLCGHLLGKWRLQTMRPTQKLGHSGSCSVQISVWHSGSRCSKVQSHCVDILLVGTDYNQRRSS